MNSLPILQELSTLQLPNNIIQLINNIKYQEYQEYLKNNIEDEKTEYIDTNGFDCESNSDVNSYFEYIKEHN